MPRATFLRLLLFFLGPAALIYSLFSIYPLLATILNSFYAHQKDGSYLWNGLGNFHTLLFDPTWSAPFWNALRNNVVFFLIHMLVQNPIALLLATAWLLTMSHNQPARDWPLYALTLLTTLIVWRTKVHMLLLIGIGALLGALGWV